MPDKHRKDPTTPPKSRKAGTLEKQPAWIDALDDLVVIEVQVRATQPWWSLCRGAQRRDRPRGLFRGREFDVVKIPGT